MPVTELIIDRTRWGQAALLNNDGTMCCLGFLSKACGVSDDLLVGVAYPQLAWINRFGVNKEFAGAVALAASINDSSQYTKEEKEIILIQLFKDNGIALTFTGNHRE